MSRINIPACGKIYISVPLRLESPLIIGSGESEHSDIDVLRDPITGQPLIPATSIIGVFRSYLSRTLCELEGRLSPIVKDNFKYLFGYLATEGEKEEAEKKKTAVVEGQSALQCDDIILNHASVLSRDGVRIDPKSNTAEDKKKYDYELVETADEFVLTLEIALRQVFDETIFKRLLLTVLKGVNQGHIRLGAKTNKGFGKIGIDLNAVAVTELNFATPQHVLQWLSDRPAEPANGKLDEKTIKSFDFERRQFNIDAWFTLKSALLIKSYASDPRLPDAVSIDRAVGSGEKRRRQAVLPGTSVMGAVRHRAQKILHTLGDNEAKARLRNLFGYVDVEGEEDEEKKKENISPAKPPDTPEQPPATKGRVRIEETLIENVAREVQTRIKIDRFTGGTIHGALFEMMPVWQKGNDDAVHIVITVEEYNEWEAGLFLLILKDLWTGDLAIGGEKNIGRGVLQGRRAEIRWKGGHVRLQADAQGRLVNGAAALDPLKIFEQKLQEAIR